MASKTRSMSRAAASGTPDEQPAFDLGNLSWADSKRISINGQRIQRSGATVEDMEAIFAEMEAVLAKVVLSVPRGWLVRDAPEIIDWSDLASFQWLRGNKMMPLIQAMQAENQGN